MSISSEMARRIMEACKQRARELHSPVSIAIVDAGGHLVLFERMMAPYGFATGNMAIAKASTSVMFNQSTDSVAQWGATIPGFAASLAAMTDGKFLMAAGGWPLRVDNVTIAGVGVSGGNAPGRDDEIAQAGLAALEALVPGAQAASVQTSTPSLPDRQAPYTQSLYAEVATSTNPEAYAPSQGVQNGKVSPEQQQDQDTTTQRLPRGEGNPGNTIH